MKKKRTFKENAGRRIVGDAIATAGLYVIGGITYSAGKKIIATTALLAMGGFLIASAIDGVIADKLINKKR